jgi:hypothetical protein
VGESVKKHVVVHISTKLSPEEWDRIERFKARVKELIATEIVSAEGHGISANISYKHDQGLKFTAVLPKEDLLRSLFLTFRFFYLNDEPSNFFRVANILKRHAGDPDVKRFVDRLKQRWKDAVFGGAMGISVNDEKITADLLLDLWFNAHYFHSDKGKEQKLKILTDTLGADFCRYMLADAVYEASKAIFRLYDALRTCERPAI